MYYFNQTHQLKTIQNLHEIVEFPIKMLLWPLLHFPKLIIFYYLPSFYYDDDGDDNPSCN